MRLVPSAIRGFYVFESPATRTEGRPSGGIVIGLGPKFAGKLVYRSESVVAVTTEHIDILGCYFTPNTPLAIIADELSSALAFLDGSKSIIVAGDFNVNILKSDTDRTVEFLQFMNKIGLLLRSSNFQHIYSHPRGSSVIDLIFSNTDRVNGSVLSESQWSLVRGHNPVQFDWSQETCSRGKTVLPHIIPKPKRQG
ncbi:hypothetical protein ACOME3_003531 [Neoechinorhynchus agilis]